MIFLIVTRCIYLLYSLFLFFFFQAEDGIRDVAVTGVQTCALPISPPATRLAFWINAYNACMLERVIVRYPIRSVRRIPSVFTAKHCRVAGAARSQDRSEEHTSELQSRLHLVCRLLLEKKKPLLCMTYSCVNLNSCP